MARVSVVLLNFCLLFFTLIHVNSNEIKQDLNSDIYNLYNVHPEISQGYEIEIKHLTKRDTQNAKNPIDTNRSERVMPTDAVDSKTLTKSNSEPLKNQTLILPVAKNLGVNGTGQRIHYEEGKNDKPLLETIVSKEVTKPLIKTTNLNTTVVPTNNTKENDKTLITVDNFLEEEETLNKTLVDHNITSTNFIDDDHLYYTSRFAVDPVGGPKYWVYMDNRSDVKVNELLSQSHRRAATVKLSFDFPFYGHLIRNITIATGGFLYTGEYVHSWLAATQYIAPLMANFDTSLSNESFVKYVDNGTAFTVQWEKVSLKDKPNEGEFTFQATMHRNGDIVFVYKDVPVIITQIKDDQHPVKVGLSDAYIIDRTIFFVRRKTIYEYHRVHFGRDDIKNWTVIYLRASPTCLDMKNCTSCLTKLSNFQCKWCYGANRCSSGVDRHRQDWLVKGCEEHQALNVSECNGKPKNDINIISKNINHGIDDDNSLALNAEKASRIGHASEESKYDPAGMHPMFPSLIACVIVFFVFASTGWICYAYRNPHTLSGQWLIRYRPSQWSWRRGEARYTAATIHM